MTTLVNTSNKGPSTKKKGRSKKAHVLAVSVEQATQNFLEKGEQIAKDSQDLKEELIAAVEDVRKQGKYTVYIKKKKLKKILYIFKFFLIILFSLEERRCVSPPQSLLMTRVLL